VDNQPKPKFVQFIHPGGEHIVKDGNIKQWNDEPHRRKFMEVEGTYCENGDPIDSTLHFWGEWEPQSDVTNISKPIVDGPTCIHHPFWIRQNRYAGLQNTDPFVFGNQFQYAICQQHKNGRATFLRDLDRGSVILFGSCKSKTQFVIDTVFVVRSWIDGYNRDNFATRVAPYIDQTYSTVTFGPLFGIDLGDTCPKRNCVSSAKDQAAAEMKDSTFRLYFGATLNDDVDGMFSFFPCLDRDTSGSGFARPVIEIGGLITNTLMQGKKGNGDVTANGATMKDRWNEVVRQVEQRGLKLGIFARIPDLRI